MAYLEKPYAHFKSEPKRNLLVKAFFNFIFTKWLAPSFVIIEQILYPFSVRTLVTMHVLLYVQSLLTTLG